MTFEFPCPWCGADTSMRGSDQASWRFRVPCELCTREMVVTFEGVLSVSRVADAAPPMERSDEATVRIKLAR
jgi:hypothetical protein